MILPREASEGLKLLLPVLQKHDVDVIAIGGLAVAYYGHRRISGGPVKGDIKADFDFWYKPTTENYYALLKALKEIDVDVDEIERRTFDPKRSFLKIPHKTFHMDFMPVVMGLSSYKDSKEKAAIQIVNDCKMAVLGFEDLMANKRAVDRAIDRDDISALDKRRKDGI